MSDNVVMNVRLPADLYKLVREAAKKQDRSASSYVRCVLRAALRKIEDAPADEPGSGGKREV